MSLPRRLLRRWFRRRISPDEDSCFDPDARQVLRRARAGAGAAGARQIDGEHLLGAIVGESASGGAAVLLRLGVPLPTVAAAMARESEAPERAGPCERPETLAYSSRAERVLSLALASAEALGHRQVSSAHLLLGLREDRLGTAANILADLGVDLAAAQAATSQILAADLTDSGAW